MGQALQQLKPIGSMNTDADNKYLSASDKRYSLNSEPLPSNGTNTSTPGNTLLPYSQPEGRNIPIKTYNSVKTNEVYVFVHNDLNNHHIYRIRGNDNVREMVLLDAKLNFSLERRYRPRVYLFYNHSSFIQAQNKIFRKYLVWTDGQEWQGCLDVETSIATNGFRNSYFTTTDRKQLWQLAPRPSLICPLANFIDPTGDDASKPNKLKENTWQYRIKFIFTDGRQSAWSPISTTLLLDQYACRPDASGLPRAVNLTLDAGGPGVEQIILAYRNCAGNFDVSQNPDWYQTAIINKYNECLNSAQPFWERTINDDLQYDAASNTIHYTFSNEGTCIPVARAETDRNYNNIPNTSFVLAPLNNSLLLINNETGQDPLSCDSLKNISLSAIEDPGSQACVLQMATVKVALIIHNIWLKMNEFVFVKEDTGGDTDGLQKLYGGLGGKQAGFALSVDPIPYKQTLWDTSKDAGFAFYVEGADAVGISKQYKVVGTSETPAIPSKANFNTIYNDILNGQYYYIQIAEMQVVKGTKGFIRVSASDVSTADEYRSTSANVMGQLRDISMYNPNADINDANTDFATKEIYFDTCDGDADLTNKPLIILDLATYDAATVGDQQLIFDSIAFAGYVKDVNGAVVAGAEVVPFGATYRGISCQTTDYNGRYFAALIDGGIETYHTDCGVDINIEGDTCAKVHGGSYVHPPPERPEMVFENTIVADTPDYETNWSQVIRVLVEDTNGNPIPGVSVALEKEKSRITGVDGYANFFIRNLLFNYGQTHALRVIIMQSGVCYLTQTGCNACMPVKTIVLDDCFNHPPDIVISDFPHFNSPALDHGWHPGGLYPVAVKCMDAAGRETFAEEIGTIQLPAIQEKGVYSFSKIQWNITGNLNLPSKYVRMSILIGRNRNFDDFVSWVVDKVQFVDAGGAPASNNAADKILLSIRSIYDAQVLYGGNSNVKYQFKPGDIVEFIANGDGTIFNLPIKSLQFPIEGNASNMSDANVEDVDKYSNLVIGYTRDLSGLVEGAQIKLITPRTCVNTEFFYETCATLRVVDGEPTPKFGTINGWDTYLLRRGIRYKNITHDYSFPFLHHSPADTWGDHCIDRGRVSVTNPYRRRQQSGRQLMSSENFLENGNFNGIGTFIDSFVKEFSGEQRGDITGCISKEQIILMICEYDNFLVNSADGYARINPQTRQLTAASPDDKLTDAQGKIIGTYGCHYDDVGSIIDGEGFVFWGDAFNKCPVIHDWQIAKDASAGIMQDYFFKKFGTRALLQSGQSPQVIDLISGYDPVMECVLFTFYNRTAPDSFTHSRSSFHYEENETIAFRPKGNTFPTMYAFTPMAYAMFPNSLNGKTFISFILSAAWLHRDPANTNSNTFYGVACDEILDLVVNEMPQKVKGFLTMQQQSTLSFYPLQITTSLGQTSYIPPVRVQKITEGKYDVEFLCDTNSKGGLYDGDMLRGNWMRMLLVRDNTLNFKVGATDVNKQKKFNELDSILAKFMLSEQSAYNSND